MDITANVERLLAYECITFFTLYQESTRAIDLILPVTIPVCPANSRTTQPSQYNLLFISRCDFYDKAS